ncbi:hypothetical protein GYA19_04580 [Candidatus Beckwithbacteria bacterium]|nr:hypothetical protein [Candidatus Beckwithbacteria bacterium]
MKKISQKIFLSLVFLFLAVQKSFAQIDIGKTFTLGDNGTTVADSQYSSLGKFISNLVPNILMIASVFFFILILGAGFMIISSAGNPDKQKKGGETLSWSLIGFLVVFGAYWLIQIISYILGYDILNPGI